MMPVMLVLTLGCPPVLAAPPGLASTPSSAHRGAVGLNAAGKTVRRGAPAPTGYVPAYRRYRYATPHGERRLLRSLARDEIWALRGRQPTVFYGLPPARAPSLTSGGVTSSARLRSTAAQPCRLSPRELCVPAGAPTGRLELWCDSRHLRFELGPARRPSVLACPWSDIESVWFRSSGRSAPERLEVPACPAACAQAARSPGSGPEPKR
jgi:hypothetical protein